MEILTMAAGALKVRLDSGTEILIRQEDKNSIVISGVNLKDLTSGSIEPAGEYATIKIGGV